ncbi:PIN domain-containing protein [Paracandidimonas lactea]|jgi:hypothetical protein|uniref:PIN domain-containing protein n=1 Tax=Paracandidimonas lactea TaxID=2895524 RepID=UPI001928BA46|nr:PIN domain-containing protein [Paracandidimonas lactea]
MPDLIVLDTCVLISNVMREGLLSLARQGCYLPVWSAVIGDEWRRNAARLWAMPAQDVQAQWDTLQHDWPRACLGDVSAWKEGLRRSDPKDMHVVAAARKAAGDPAGVRRVAIVTRNVRDFHRGELYHLGLELLDPDQLLCRCLAHHPQAVQAMLAAVPAYAMAHGREPEALETILRRERLFRFNRLVHALDREGAPPATTVPVPA